MDIRLTKLTGLVCLAGVSAPRIWGSYSLHLRPWGTRPRSREGAVKKNRAGEISGPAAGLMDRTAVAPRRDRGR